MRQTTIRILFLILILFFSSPIYSEELTTVSGHLISELDGNVHMSFFYLKTSYGNIFMCANNQATLKEIPWLDNYYDSDKILTLKGVILKDNDGGLYFKDEKFELVENDNQIQLYVSMDPYYMDTYTYFGKIGVPHKDLAGFSYIIQNRSNVPIEISGYSQNKGKMVHLKHNLKLEPGQSNNLFYLGRSSAKLLYEIDVSTDKGLIPLFMNH